jgi:hypothetical protein
VAFITIGEDEAKDERIPQDANFTLVSVQAKGGSKHGETEVILRGRATGSIGVNLDPGVYRIKVNALGNPDPNDQVLWGRTFRVGIEDDAAMRRLRAMKPSWAKPINTSDGARWNCKFPGGCNHRSTSIIGAVVHEYEAHLGMDPLKANKPAALKAAVTKATMTTPARA